MGNIYFISGPCGVGKSTLADAFAKHLTNTGVRKQVYVIHGDDFHQGFVETDYKDSFWEKGQAADQIVWTEILKFNWECIIETAGKVLDRGLDVVIDYVVEEELPLLLKLAKEHEAKLYYVVLTASENVITQRIEERGDTEMVERALFLKKELEELPENQGHIFDNTGKSVAEEIIELSENMESYLCCTADASDENQEKLSCVSGSEGYAEVPADNGPEDNRKEFCNDISMQDKTVYYQDAKLTIRSMVPEDAKVYYDTYLSYDWHPQLETYENYYREQQNGERLVFVPEIEGRVVGICTLVLHPSEGPWGGQNIPEIVDLCVFFHIHKSGIGSKLLDVAEAEAAKRSDMVFLAVGCHSGYGAAQRIYVKRGYIPDGSGVWYQNKQLDQYAPCVNDDDLLLFMSKKLK
ncbi:MAG: GNAT family N-acetyltransferase [Lachnospiraceae bacterium]|nr:GNAT family N-acetyltransferase [Lachnospiraceae bacterium]